MWGKLKPQLVQLQLWGQICAFLLEENFSSCSSLQYFKTKKKKWFGIKMLETFFFVAPSSGCQVNCSHLIGPSASFLTWSADEKEAESNFHLRGCICAGSEGARFPVRSCRWLGQFSRHATVQPWTQSSAVWGAVKNLPAAHDGMWRLRCHGNASAGTRNGWGRHQSADVQITCHFKDFKYETSGFLSAQR